MRNLLRRFKRENSKSIPAEGKKVSRTLTAAKRNQRAHLRKRTRGYGDRFGNPAIKRKLSGESDYLVKFFYEPHHPQSVLPTVVQ